jgi:SAM-dependent methyltransferase
MARTKAFDEHSRQYEQWFAENRWVYQSELKAVSHFIPPSGVGVEIGVGSGRFAAPFDIKIGIEPSKTMRKLAQRRGIEVYEGVAECLPFEAEGFDFALMVTTICFLDDAEKSFQEVKRILKNGGLFIIGFVDHASPLGKRYETRKSENVFYREATFYSTDAVLSLLKQSGFIEPAVIQTVFGELSEIKTVQDFREGHGQGGFVVVKAKRASKGQRK